MPTPAPRVALPEAADIRAEEGELMKEIIAAHPCAENPNACCIINTDPDHEGEHIHFTNDNIGIWATAAVRTALVSFSVLILILPAHAYCNHQCSAS